jgi:hypothetical protein
VAYLDYCAAQGSAGQGVGQLEVTLSFPIVQTSPIEYASRLEQALNAGIHIFLINEFAARDLVDSHLHLLFEPRIVGEQASDSLLHQVICASSGLEGKVVELGFLILR